jgi:uncharacterized protein (DUF1778 family)
MGFTLNPRQKEILLKAAEIGEEDASSFVRRTVLAEAKRMLAESTGARAHHAV